MNYEVRGAPSEEALRKAAELLLLQLEILGREHGVEYRLAPPSRDHRDDVATASREEEREAEE